MVRTRERTSVATRAKKEQLQVVLPFDITKQSKGAQKAYANMVEFYGKQKGTQVFLQKAEEQGKGSTIREKVNSIYHRGAKIETEK